MKQRSPKNEIKIYKIVQKDDIIFEFFLEKYSADEIVRENIYVLADVVAEQGFLKPTTITEEQYYILLEQSTFHEAYRQALKYLGYRKRSVEEIRGFLLKKKVFSSITIQQVIDKLLEQQYLDDTDFAISYIQTARKTTLKGPARLNMELQNLGCADSIIETQLGARFGKDVQEGQLLALFQKMISKKYISQNEMLNKYNQKAVDLGYGYDVINKIKAQCSFEQIQVEGAKIDKIIAQSYARLVKKGYSDFELNQRLRHKLQTKGLSSDDATQYLSDFYAELGRKSET